MDDSQFLGSMMGDTVLAQPAPATPPAPPPPPATAQHQQQQVLAPPVKKRGRPPRNGAVVAAAAPTAAAAARQAAAAAARKKEEDEDEVVCFICFDGGDLVVCDRRGCPKVYHPACVKRDEAFFQGRSKWNCGWHICSSCEKPVHYMCYTCTFSVCKVCIKHGKFFSVRGTKGFCDTCFGTILLVEAKDDADTKVRVDFDDRYSWEYLFKLYWLDLKGKLSLTMEELTAAKSRWNAPITYARKEKDESSDDLYDANYDGGAGSDCSSKKRRRSNSSRKRGRKNGKTHPIGSITVENGEMATGNAESLPKKLQSDRVFLPLDAKWASPELLEFVGHMRDGDQSFISQFDVQALLLEYIKKNDLRNPRRKSQIICDSRLHSLFRKTHVAHFEMLRLLEMHCPVSDASTVNNGNHEVINPSSGQVDASGYGEITGKLCPDRKKKVHRKMETEPQKNLEDYAAIDMHNINLIYLRRSLMEDLIDDPAFSEKISGGFVRIKITDVGQKQHMYRLVKVVGTHKVSEKYSTGKKTTNFALEILNLSKKEIITMDTISNQDFTEEECRRLRQSMKYDLISRLRVGDIQEKATIFQSVRFNDRLENEKQRLGYLRDRASETGRKKELREYVEKLQLLNTSEERTRIMNELLQVHVDSHMDPEYDSAEETDDKTTVERNENGKRSNGVSPIKVQKFAKKMADAIRHPKNLSKQSSVCKLGTVRNSKNFHSTVRMDIPKSGNNVSKTEAAPLISSPVTLSSDTEPEKVWHYKDPSGNVQGPFTLLQLSKWTAYFPSDLRVWLIFESEERSLLLTEVLSKQPKDFGQAASVRSSKTTLAGSAQHRNRLNVDMNSTPSPAGYNTSSVPERGSAHSSGDRVSLTTSSVPPKDADTDNCRSQHHVPSSGSPHEEPDLQERCSAKWNNGHSRGDLWSPGTTQASCSGQNSTESKHDQHASRSQVQHDSKSSLQNGSVKDFDLRQEYSQTIPTQLTRRDVPSPVLALSPSESRTASSQHESSCLSSTNPSLHDELHSSITSEKAKNCAPATSVEDRGSSSPSDMLTHSEKVPVCSPQPVPSTVISAKCKVGEIRKEKKTCGADASVASVNQSPQFKTSPDSSPDNQDIEHQYSTPVQKSESKKSDMDKSGSTPLAPETLDTKIPDHSPVAFVSPKSDLPTGVIGATCSVSKLEKADLSGEDLRTQNKRSSEPILVPREKSVADPASCAGLTDATDALESVSDLLAGKIETINSVPNIEKTDLSCGDLNTHKECYSEATLVPREKLVADLASCAKTVDVSDVPESVSNLEKKDSRGQDSSIQKEVYNESVLFAREKMVVDPAPCAETIGVSHVPEQDLKGENPNILKELYSESALGTSEKMVVEPASCSESIYVSDVLQSVSNLERRDLKDKDSIIQRELFSESTLVTSEKLVVDPAPCAESVDVSDVLESVFNLERTDLKGEHSHIQKQLPGESIIVTRKNMVNDPAPCGELMHVSGALESLSNLEKTFLEGEGSDMQKELHEGSTFVTREMVVDPAPCGESRNVSGPLESLIEQNRGTLCMDAIAAIEQFMTTSAEEEPQCSSPIALSPWGESGYYQGDAVDSALWGVQDDPINDMWSLLSPTPALQQLSGVKTEGEGVHGIDAVPVTQGEIDFFQRGPTQGIHGADAVPVTQGEIDFFQRGPTQGQYWGLTEQVKPKATPPPVDLNTGLFGWQPPASERSNTAAVWNTSSQNPNLYYSYETAAAPSVRTSQQAVSVKREFTDFDAPNSREALGNNNTKSWNTGIGNANRGSQRSDRYSQISESWLLSSNNTTRSRPDGVGGGGASSRAAPRGSCTFHESGYCRKGSSCNYLHR